MKKLNRFSTIVLTCSLLLQLSALSFHSHAAPGDVNLSFDPGSGVNGHIYAIAMQPDGKAIIGGAYLTRVKGVACQNIARINPDGSGDSTFNYSDPNLGFSAVRAIALQTDGKVLAGHNNGISRLNPDGSVDADFINPSILGHGLGAVSVDVIAVQSDGKILIGGGFRSVNGSLRSGIARLHSDGGLDQLSFLKPVITIFPRSVPWRCNPTAK